MVSMDGNMKSQIRFDQDAGIAIGPILFVIAVLGILASAIAAGSGSFTAGSSTEGNRTKAAAMIEIGQNLKIGFDRITGTGGVDVANVVISVDSTSGTSDLFSPLGGGITVPSPAMSGAPATDVWHYPQGSVTGIGSGGTNTDQLAVLNVASGVCAEINNKVMGSVTIPSADIGNILQNQTAVTQIASNWPNALKGQAVGCIQNTDGSATGYFFYQVIGVR